MAIDKSDMRKIILQFPQQFQKGLEAAKKVSLKPDDLLSSPKNIIICGMGGSALIGDILVNIRPLNLFIHKSYGLPLQAGNESLIICVSYSGNTEETISAFKEALKRKLTLIVITTGGQLKKLAEKNDVPVVVIPPPYTQPRLGLGVLFSALIQTLANLYLVSQSFVDDVCLFSKNLKTKPMEAQAKKLAKKIYQKLPLIYSSKSLAEVTLIWKNLLNENSKILAIANYFPELNHNEIVGFWKINDRQVSCKKLLALILSDRKDNPRILKRIKITCALMKKEGVAYQVIDIKGKNMLEKTFSAIILGYWTSYWLALEYKIDPTPVKPIENLKNKMKGK